MEVMVMEENLEFLFEQHEKDEEWFNANYNKLKREQGSKFFAIKDRKPIAIDEDIEKLLKTLEKKKIDINLVFITSIPPEGVASIL